MSKNETEKAEIAHGIESQEGRDSKWLRYLIITISATFSLIFLYTAGFGIFGLFVQRSLFLLFSLVLVFLLYPLRDDIVGHIIDGGLVALTILSNGYILLNYQDIALQAGIPDGPLEIALGVILLLLIFEASRRTVGMVLPILASIFIAYGLWGNLLPSFWGHGGYTFNDIIGYLYLTPNGIWSFPVGIASTYIITFVIFGAFLLKSGIGDLFTNLAMRLAGRVTGGPAQVAVVTSSLFGMVSGAAPANVATTGSVTIPTMKSIGFDKDFAGAVESSASAGGLLMPPIMGAAAFLMVEFTGIPYREIIIAAIVPAVLYYTGIAFSVYFVAKQLGIGGQSKEQLAQQYPDPLEELKKRGHMIIPMVILIVFVLIGWAVTTAAFYSIVAAVVISWLRSNTRMTPRRIVTSLDDGGRKILEIAMAVATAGIIYAIVNLTGLGVKFSYIMLNYAEISLFIALGMIMIGCIVLGMGLPATVAYLITAAVTAPGMEQLGFSTLASHLFIFYFSILATVTPPVGLALYTAAAIAEGHWLRTGLKGLKLTFAGFIVPYILLFDQSYLLRGGSVGIAIGIVSAIAGCIALAYALNGPAGSKYLRAVTIITGAALFYPSILTRAVGLIVFSALALQQLTDFERFATRIP